MLIFTDNCITETGTVNYSFYLDFTLVIDGMPRAMIEVGTDQEVLFYCTDVEKFLRHVEIGMRTKHVDLRIGAAVEFRYVFEHEGES